MPTGYPSFVRSRSNKFDGCDIVSGRSSGISESGQRGSATSSTPPVNVLANTLHRNDCGFSQLTITQLQEIIFHFTKKILIYKEVAYSFL